MRDSNQLPQPDRGKSPEILTYFHLEKPKLQFDHALDKFAREWSEKFGGSLAERHVKDGGCLRGYMDNSAYLRKLFGP